jgi:hypothetical protein
VSRRNDTHFSHQVVTLNETDHLYYSPKSSGAVPGSAARRK